MNWWSSRSADEKKLFHSVVVIAEDLLDGEVLKLTFTGQGFAAALVSERDPATQPGRTAGKVTPGQSDEEWWATISPTERTLTRELAKLMKELQSDRDKTLEITNTDEKLTATLVLNLKKPTGGRAATN
jgi:hypothetical protein